MTRKSPAPSKAEAPATPAALGQQLVIRRRTPDLNAYLYDGTNAVYVASWVNQQGGACQVAFPAGANALPQLIDGNGQPVPVGVYVLPTLETVPADEIGVVYDVVSTVV